MVIAFDELIADDSPSRTTIGPSFGNQSDPYPNDSEDSEDVDPSYSEEILSMDSPLDCFLGIKMSFIKMNLYSICNRSFISFKILFLNPINDFPALEVGKCRN